MTFERETLRGFLIVTEEFGTFSSRTANTDFVNLMITVMPTMLVTNSTEEISLVLES